MHTHTPSLARSRTHVLCYHDQGTLVSRFRGLALGEECLQSPASDLSENPKCGETQGQRLPLDSGIGPF